MGGDPVGAPTIYDERRVGEASVDFAGVCHHNGVVFGVEKRRPTYDLPAIAATLGDPAKLAMTRSALSDALSLGFDRVSVAAAIRGIRPEMFYKSMTTNADHRVWQDVYHVPAGGLLLYVKFQADAIAEFRVVSFKER